MADNLLSNMQVSVFCSSIAMMLRSGVAASEACLLLSQDVSGAAAQVSGAISREMDAGQTFADAARATGMFPGYALGVFRTAELSGRLDEALDRLAGYYERQYGLNQRLSNTLTYPLMLMLMICGVLSVLVLWVLPMFEKVYGSLTGGLAASSYVYVTAAAVIGRVSLAAAVLVSAALLALAFLMRTGRGRERLRGPMERSRLTGQAAWNLAVSKFCDSMSTLLASGTDPDTAVALSAEMTDHTGLRTVLDTCAEEMRMGTGLADSLFRHNVFPALYGRMLVSGAESGNLGRTMENLSDRLGRDAEDALIGVIDATEPVLIGFLTVSVGMTLLSVMLPLLGILGAV